jgi:hypothetical protein
MLIEIAAVFELLLFTCAWVTRRRAQRWQVLMGPRPSLRLPVMDDYLKRETAGASRVERLVASQLAALCRKAVQTQSFQSFNLEDHSMNTFTPSSKGNFAAGIGLWLLAWAALFKLDDLGNLCGFQRWCSRDKCLRWIRGHKSTSLLITEAINFATHGISDPLGVTFALGGTLVNGLMIFIIVPALYRAKRRGTVPAIEF